VPIVLFVVKKTLFPPYLQNNKTTLVEKIARKSKLQPYLPYLAPRKVLFGRSTGEVNKANNIERRAVICY